MTLDAYDEAHPCRFCWGTEIDSGWYSLGLQDGEAVVFVVPGGGPVVNPVVGLDRSQWERLFSRCLFVCSRSKVSVIGLIMFGWREGQLD